MAQSTANQRRSGTLRCDPRLLQGSIAKRQLMGNLRPRLKQPPRLGAPPKVNPLNRILSAGIGAAQLHGNYGDVSAASDPYSWPPSRCDPAKPSVPFSAVLWVYRHGGSLLRRRKGTGYTTVLLLRALQRSTRLRKILRAPHTRSCWMSKFGPA